MSGVERGSQDQAGSQGVYTDPVWPQFIGQASREGEHGPFRGGVRQRAGVAAFAACERGEVDDGCSRIGFGAGDQMGQGSASDTAEAAKVELHDFVPESIGPLRERSPGDEGTRIVDQDVQATEAGHGLIDDMFTARRGCQIGGGRPRASSHGLGFGHKPFCLRGAAMIMDKYVAAGLHEMLADG